MSKNTGVELCSLDELKDLDGIIYAVPHAPYAEDSFQDIGWRYRGAGIFVDIRSVFEGQLPENVAYWSL